MREDAAGCKRHCGRLRQTKRGVTASETLRQSRRMPQRVRPMASAQGSRAPRAGQPVAFALASASGLRHFTKMRGFLVAPLVAFSLLASPGLAPRAALAEPCPTAQAQRLFLPRAQARLQAGRPLTILAFGSSSTEGSGASDQAHSYPAQLEARLRAAFPGLRLRVLNRGKGGQDVQEMLARLETDVLAERPAVVIWQAGANAVLQGMMTPEAFSAAMAVGIARIRAIGAEVVLMDSQRAPRILSAPGYARFDTALRDLSLEAPAPLFSRAALMREWEAAGTPNAEMLSPDGLHHNDRGYACLAAALAQSLQAALAPARVAGR